MHCIKLHPNTFQHQHYYHCTAQNSIVALCGLWWLSIERSGLIKFQSCKWNYCSNISSPHLLLTRRSFLGDDEDDGNDNEDSDKYCNAMMMMGSAKIVSADGASSQLVLICQYGPTTFCRDYPYQLIPVSFAFHSSAVSNLCSHL